MKTGIQKSNPVLAFWQRIVLDGRVDALAIKWREKVGIPSNGFDTYDDYEIWHKEIIQKNKEKQRISETQKFVDEAVNLIPYSGTLSETHFRGLMIDFFYLGDVDVQEFEKLEFSGMKVLFAKDGKFHFSVSKKLEDGVYIKINPFLKISKIKEYIEREKVLIRSAQDLYFQAFKISKPKKIKLPTHFNRDRIILMLDGYSNKELKDKYGVSKAYKHMTISGIMNNLGAKEVTPEIVKSIIQRRYLKK